MCFEKRQKYDDVVLSIVTGTRKLRERVTQYVNLIVVASVGDVYSVAIRSPSKSRQHTRTRWDLQIDLTRGYRFAFSCVSFSTAPRGDNAKGTPYISCL